MSEIDCSAHESEECLKPEDDNIIEYSNSDDHCKATCSDELHNNVMSSRYEKDCENAVNEGKKNKFAVDKNLRETPKKSKLQSTHRRSRTRNLRKRKWKPYTKLNWVERRKVDERDSRRAFKIREQMSSLGITLAPYNTTQFLMEDHNLQEPDYERIHGECKHEDYVGDLDSDGYYNSPKGEEDFIQQQFTETYENSHANYINSMRKFELVRELMRLEDEAEELEKSLKEVRDKNEKNPQPSVVDVEAEMEKINVFEAEIRKLLQENFVLSMKNERLHRFLTQSS